jgi:Fe-S-cluster containining protein
VEIRSIARHLGLELDTFGQRFLRRVGRRLSLIDKSNHDCIFWEDGCSVYSVRPRQCRTFPFWDRHLQSSTAWQAAAGECAGIGDGRLYQLSEIEALRRGRGATAAEPSADRD